jgi:hypothetical protein
MAAPKAPIDFFLDDQVRLRKPHPCGSYDWTVVRLGADIGLKCQGCGRRVLLPRRVLEKRVKTFLSRGPAYDAAMAAIEAHQSQSEQVQSVEDDSIEAVSA